MRRIPLIFRAFLFALLAASFTNAHALTGMPSRALADEPSQPAAFRVASLPVSQRIALPAPLEKRSAAIDASGRLRVADVRALPKSTSIRQWTQVGSVLVTHLEAVSEEAEGLRVRLDIGAIAAPVEVRVKGSGERVETMRIEPGGPATAWTPWTEGPRQTIELVTGTQPDADAVKVGAFLHFTDSPFAKVAALCTLSTRCSTGDPALDSAIEERKKSVVRINFIEGGGGFLCSATLINTERFPEGFLLTANHCISTMASATSVTSFWFYETNTCADLTVNPGFVQLAGGTELVFGNYSADSTLLRTNNPPPPGAVYSGWNAARLTAGTAVVSLSHPRGDTSRVAIGSMTREYRVNDLPQDQYGVTFSRGIIEGGSSGSGLFTMAGGSLELRGILTGTTVRQGGMSCSNTQDEALYSRFEVLAPQIVSYIGLSARPPDDAPNRFQDWLAVPMDASGPDRPLDERAETLSIDGRGIDYIGDVDVYRFTLTNPAAVSAWTDGFLDTIGYILDASGSIVQGAANDDVQVRDTNFGLTRLLSPGTYYLVIAPWDPHVTGSYHLRMRADGVDQNFTDLWWQPSEPGWGVNFNHQGNILFGTLFTYDLDGSQMWLVMPNGQRQPDGSYAGELLRTTGPPFNATPWSNVANSPVGSMRVRFDTPSLGTLTYTVNGTTVAKSISRQEFSSRPSCMWSAFDRSYATNFQDLWWNPAQPGWGVNITHQGNTLFATLFTYDASGRGMWLVMSNGEQIGAASYSGTLYRTTGPAFNASPWTPNANVAVGTMTFNFVAGNSGTLTYTVDGIEVTKSIERQTFSAPATECES